MARVLVVGGGERALALVRDLAGDGHAARVAAVEADAVRAAGGEAVDGDPDVVGTLRYALDNVTLLLWLLGTARGTSEGVAALHCPRLRMMLERTVDTTVRGVVYEAAGSVGAEALRAGVAELRRARERDEIPFRVVEADPADPVAWRGATRRAVDELLGAR